MTHKCWLLTPGCKAIVWLVASVSTFKFTRLDLYSSALTIIPRSIRMCVQLNISKRCMLIDERLQCSIVTREQSDRITWRITQQCWLVQVFAEFGVVELAPFPSTDNVGRWTVVELQIDSHRNERVVGECRWLNEHSIDRTVESRKEHVKQVTSLMCWWRYMLYQTVAVDKRQKFDSVWVICSIEMNVDVPQNNDWAWVRRCSFKDVSKIIKEHIVDWFRTWSVEHDVERITLSSMDVHSKYCSMLNVKSPPVI